MGSEAFGILFQVLPPRFHFFVPPSPATGCRRMTRVDFSCMTIKRLGRKEPSMLIMG